MFITAELNRFRVPSEPSAPTQWSQMTQTPSSGTYRMADVLHIVRGNPDYPACIYFLVISDGQRHAVAVLKGVVLEQTRIDLSLSIARSALIEYTGFVPVNPLTMSPDFERYVRLVNSMPVVLQVTQLVFQGRGPTLNRPYMKIHEPPSNVYHRDDEYEIPTNLEPAECFKTATDSSSGPRPQVYEVKRAPQFQHIDDSDEFTDFSPSPMETSPPSSQSACAAM